MAARSVVPTRGAQLDEQVMGYQANARFALSELTRAVAEQAAYYIERACEGLLDEKKESFDELVTRVPFWELVRGFIEYSTLAGYLNDFGLDGHLVASKITEELRRVGLAHKKRVIYMPASGSAALSFRFGD